MARRSTQPTAAHLKLARLTPGRRLQLRHLQQCLHRRRASSVRTAGVITQPAAGQAMRHSQQLCQGWREAACRCSRP
jgi:hypothetical protein